MVDGGITGRRRAHTALAHEGLEAGDGEIRRHHLPHKDVLDNGKLQFLRSPGNEAHRREACGTESFRCGSSNIADGVLVYRRQGGGERNHQLHGTGCSLGTTTGRVPKGQGVCNLHRQEPGIHRRAQPEHPLHTSTLGSNGSD